MTRDGQSIARILNGSWRQDTGTAETVPNSELPRLSEILASTGSAGLAYRRLGSESAGESLKAAAQSQQLAHLLQTRAILAIADEFAQLDLPYLYFKGWVAARDYACPATRPTGDVDILVQPEDLERVLRHFWARTQTAQTAQTEQPVPETVPQTVGFTCDGVPGAIILDIHDSLEKHGLGTSGSLLERRQYSELEGRFLPHLDDASHLRQLCVHGMRHAFWRPLWLCDIAAFIETRGAEVDWDAVSGDQPVMENWVGSCVTLARDLLGADVSSVPHRFLTSCAPRWAQDNVLAAWGKDFKSYHNRRDLGYTLRTQPWGLPRELWLRRPNTLTAVAQMGWRVPQRRSLLIPLIYVARRMNIRSSRP